MPLSDAPFLGAPRRWSVSSSPTGEGPDWGLALGPYLILWPSWWVVHPCNVSDRGLAVWSQNTSLKENLEYRRGHASLFDSRLLLSDPAEPPAQRFKGPVWLESPSRNVAETGT